ncbi:hypothetical protein ABZT03_02060 [Streptomyces sp. NPDC005574]|uniref:hypothetical protein n=1 Tax=Streptomyces sp. NPDC005574 TaxID=3156891 RepID=UPI0033AB655F
MATITAPVEGYSGAGVGGLMFEDGCAETDNPAVISYARRHGYTVEGDEDGPQDTKPPARSASKAEWVAYALTQGAEQAAAERLTKEQLAEQYGG